MNRTFNVRGEPIVGVPENEFHCFMRSQLDDLTFGNCYLRKENQNPALKRNCETVFDLD
jgi:carbamoyltransferase